MPAVANSSNDCVSRDYANESRDTPTTYAAANAATDSTANATTKPNSATWPSRPLQLCGGSAGVLAAAEEGLVLSGAPFGLPNSAANKAAAPPNVPPNVSAYHLATYATAASCRSVQLRRWLRKLDGRLVCRQEGVVLSRARQGLPADRRWMWHDVTSLRLQCWICELDGGVEREQEGLVLQERG